MYPQPQMPYGPPQPPHIARPATFDAMQAVSQGWDAFKAHAGSFILALFIMGLFVAPTGYAPTILILTHAVEPNSVEQFGATLACTLLTQVVSSFFAPGLARMGIAAVRGHTAVSLGDLFKPRGMGRLLGFNLLMGVPTFVVTLLQIVLAAVDMQGVAAALGMLNLLALVPLLFAWLAWGQTTYIVADQDLGLIDAIKASARITSGHRVNVFVAYLLAGLVLFAGVLACGVGAIVSAPVMMLILAATYVRLHDLSQGNAQPGPQFSPMPAHLAQQPAAGYGQPPAGGFGGGYGPGYGPPPGGYGG
jgi:uncharacterized membrane protein